MWGILGFCSEFGSQFPPISWGFCVFLHKDWILMVPHIPSHRIQHGFRHFLDLLSSVSCLSARGLGFSTAPLSSAHSHLF